MKIGFLQNIYKSMHTNKLCEPQYEQLYDLLLADRVTNAHGH